MGWPVCGWFCERRDSISAQADGAGGAQHDAREQAVVGRIARLRIAQRIGIVGKGRIQFTPVVAVQVLRYSAVTVAELQMLSLAMALIGFFIGSVVDELRRASDELKQTLRLAAAGEMAGALAHELNQPLTALAAYGSACEMLLERGEQGDRLNAAIRGMLVESARTGEVVQIGRAHV